VAELKTWNYVGKKGLRPGKKLVVYVKVPKASSKKTQDSEKNIAVVNNDENNLVADNTRVKPQYVYHKVKKGESLFGISKKYNVDHTQLMELNTLKTKNLKYGQVLKIKTKE
jgi:membrane-bound lytic murein transglycosylase D